MLHDIGLVFDRLHLLIKTVTSLEVSLRKTGGVSQCLVDASLHLLQLLEHHRYAHGNGYRPGCAEILEGAFCRSGFLRDDPGHQCCQLIEERQHDNGRCHIEEGVRHGNMSGDVGTVSISINET